MDHTFTQLLPPPATVTSPSLEETCDIVLPPPAESLYTLPRRKNPSVEFEMLNNDTSTVQIHQEDNSDSYRGTHAPRCFSGANGDRNNRSVRFEEGPTSENVTLQQQGSSQNSSIATSMEPSNKKSINAAQPGTSV